jgi:hypothetical protein
MRIKAQNTANDMEIYSDKLSSIQKTLDIIYVPERISQIGNMISSLASEVALIKEHVSKMSSLPMEDRYMTPEEAMHYLGMTKNTFDKYRYKASYKIKAYKLDGSNRYKKSDLDRFMLHYNDQVQLLAA